MSSLLVADASQVLAAIFAILITRHRRSYLPAAVALTLIATISLVQRAIFAATQGAPVPYEGAARLLFHIDTASHLAGDATIAGLAVVVAVAPERRRRVVAIIAGVWFLASVVVAALYPSPLVRGLGLARVLFASNMLGVCVGTIAMVMWARGKLAAKRSPGAIDMVALTMLIFDAGAAILPFSPWRNAPFSLEAYSGVQGLIIGFFGVIAVLWLVSLSVGLFVDNLTERKLRRAAEKALVDVKAQVGIHGELIVECRGAIQNVLTNVGALNDNTGTELRRIDAKLAGHDAHLAQHDVEIRGNNRRLLSLGLALARGQGPPPWAQELIGAKPVQTEGDREATPPASGPDDPGSGERAAPVEMERRGHFPIEADLGTAPAAAPPASTKADTPAPAVRPTVVTLGGTSNMTSAERVAEKHFWLVREAGSAAEHCQGTECAGVVPMTCACPCERCELRRALLTRAQRTLGMPVAQMPGETPEAWALRIDLSSPTLVSARAIPPPSSSSAPRSIPLERLAHLDAEETARVDALAATLGVTREEALVSCAERGVPIKEAEARVARRWLEKIVAAEMAGVDLLCACAPCARLTSLLAEAQREVGQP
jgi:hypothetical protein